MTLDRNIDDKKIRPAPHVPANSPAIPRHRAAIRRSEFSLPLKCILRDRLPDQADRRSTPAISWSVPGGTWRLFFDLTEHETAAIFRLVTELKSRCDADFRPAGYNIAVNIGRFAGQTVMHVHVHLIPRYDGDVDDPTGGVRHVIPGKGNY